MFENYKIKLAMFELGRATVEELKAHTGGKETTIRDFLNKHKDLWNAEAAPPVNHRGRPKVHWVLTPDGKESLRCELSRLSSLAELAAERESVARQVNEAILEMIDDLDVMERPDRPENDYDVLLHDLQQDLLATSTALKQLEASGHEVKIELAALDSVRLRLRFGNA